MAFLLRHAFLHFGSIGSNNEIMPRFTCGQTAILTAPNGSKGLALAAVYPVDVVIVDYLMPEVNGKEFIAEMRQLRPGTPIIMLSGDANVPEQVLKWVDAYVAKDRLASQLLTAIAQLHGRGPAPPHLHDA